MTVGSEYVLKRDGTNVETDNACAATSGTWVSPYDGGEWTAASDVDIDHMVPLSNAWDVSTVQPLIVPVLPPPFPSHLSYLLSLPSLQHQPPLTAQSGASTWTTAKREAFANDIDGPQLWAVTDNVNQSKSDKAPDEWKPPLESFWCTYARSWIKVKSDWELSVTEAEKGALEDMLGSC